MLLSLGQQVNNNHKEKKESVFVVEIGCEIIFLKFITLELPIVLVVQTTYLHLKSSITNKKWSWPHLVKSHFEKTQNRRQFCIIRVFLKRFVSIVLQGLFVVNIQKEQPSAVLDKSEVSEKWKRWPFKWIFKFCCHPSHPTIRFTAQTTVFELSEMAEIIRRDF